MKPTGVVYMCINVCALQLEYAVHVYVHGLSNTCTQSMVQLYMYLYTSIQIHVLRAWCKCIRICKMYLQIHVLRAWCNCIRTCTYKYVYSEHGATVYVHLHTNMHVLRAWCNCIRTCTYKYTCTQTMVQLYTYW